MRPVRSLTILLVVALGFGGVGLVDLGSAGADAQQDPSGRGAFEPTGSCVNALCPEGGAVVLQDGKVLMATSKLGSPNPASEIYDPANGSWRPTGPCEGCGYGGATLVALPAGPPNVCGANCGKVLLAGGWEKNLEADFDIVTSNAFLFDPKANAGAGAWTATEPMAVPRRHHTATLLENGKVLVTGGCPGSEIGLDGLCYETPPEATAELYDPATGRWEPAGQMTVGRYRHAAARLRSGEVLLAGGSPGGPDERAGMDTAEIYDPVRNAWRTTGALGARRSDHTASTLENGKILMAGGLSGDYLNSAEVYDPATGTWQLTGILTAARHSHEAIVLHDGTVFAVGGEFSGDTTQSGELYDPVSGRWQQAGEAGQRWSIVSTALIPEGPSDACGDACGKVLLVGVGADAWLYAPAAGQLQDDAATGATTESSRQALPLIAAGLGAFALVAGLVMAAKKRERRSSSKEH